MGNLHMKKLFIPVPQFTKIVVQPEEVEIIEVRIPSIMGGSGGDASRKNHSGSSSSSSKSCSSKSRDNDHCVQIRWFVRVKRVREHTECRPNLSVVAFAK